MTTPPLSFSALPGQQGFDAWRETFALKIARIDVTPPDRSCFSADICVRPLPDVTLARSRTNACSVIRTPELLRDGDDAVSIMLCLDGRADIWFGDDSTVLRPGQAILMPHHRRGGARWQGSADVYALRIERDIARRIAPSVEAALLRTTAPDDPAFALLSAYCAQLMALPGALPDATATLAGSQIEELMAHLLGHRNALDLAGGSGVRAARLAAVKEDIARNLAHRDLSAATLATRHGMTQRQVQRLLESEGTTVTEYVLAQRLAHVRRLLGDPRRVHDKISALAAEAGFHDISHFNRTFSQHYGDTPSGIRMAALLP